MHGLSRKRAELEAIEIASRAIAALQPARPCTTLHRVDDAVTHSRAACDATGVNPGDARSRAALADDPA
jgi:hypothetical protein